MKKLAMGLLIVTAVATTTGFAAAQTGSTDNGNLSGYTKDQCKDGGWEDLGFRNQGQCVAFFARQQGGNTNVREINVTTNNSATGGAATVNGGSGDAYGGNAMVNSTTNITDEVAN